MRRSDPIKLIEVMGREAGWVAAAAALGRTRPDGAPHLVYLPERPVTPATVLADVEAVYRREGYAVVVLSENQTEPTAAGVRVLGADGDPEWVDAFGHPYYPSPAAYLTRLHFLRCQGAQLSPDLSDIRPMTSEELEDYLRS